MAYLEITAEESSQSPGPYIEITLGASMKTYEEALQEVEEMEKEQGCEFNSEEFQQKVAEIMEEEED